MNGSVRAERAKPGFSAHRLHGEPTKAQTMTETAALLDLTRDRIWFRARRGARCMAAWVSCALLRKLAGPQQPPDADVLALYRAQEVLLHTIASSVFDGSAPIALDDVPWVQAWIKLCRSRQMPRAGDEHGAPL
jgi:hypothetical protein